MEGKDRLSRRGAGLVDLHTSEAVHLQMSNWDTTAVFVAHVSLDGSL